MRKDLLEDKVNEFRRRYNIEDDYPLMLRPLLIRLGVQTFYTRLSENFSGMCYKTLPGTAGSQEPLRFMLVNSYQSRGRQHFTICHELFHLFIQPDEDFRPIACKIGDKQGDATERDADNFATLLLMPERGIRHMIPQQELENRRLSLYTIIQLSQYFGTSYEAMLYRLSQLRLLTDEEVTECKAFPILKKSRQFGFDSSLYDKELSYRKNDGLIIGDFKTMAISQWSASKISSTELKQIMMVQGSLKTKV